MGKRMGEEGISDQDFDVRRQEGRPVWTAAGRGYAELEKQALKYEDCPECLQNKSKVDRRDDQD